MESKTRAARNRRAARTHPSRPTHARTAFRRRWPVLLATALAVAAVAALIWLGNRDLATPLVVGPAHGKVKGNPDAPVQIEVWADFQCPACRLFALGPGRDLEQHLLPTGRASVVWRHMAFLGEESEQAAAAAECANEQGQFWTYHDKLFAEQAGENRGTFRADNLKRFAHEIGLDTASFNACVDSNRYLRMVQAETREARRQGVSSTPTLVINGQQIAGVQPWPVLRQLVETAPARAVAHGAEDRP